MTWEDDLRRQDDNLRAIETERQEGLRNVENTLKLIEEVLTELQERRAAIGEKEYSSQKTELLRQQQINYDLRRQFIAKKEQSKKARHDLDWAWMKCEELRNKGIRG